MKGIIIMFVLLVVAVLIWQCNKKTTNNEDIIDINNNIQSDRDILDFHKKHTTDIYQLLESVFTE